MATSTQAQVIGLLVQKIGGLGLAGLIDLPCPVFDGPVGTDEQDNYVVVHGWPGDETGQQAVWQGLGAMVRIEEYDIAVAVCCYSGGTSLPGVFDATDAQNTTRANAQAITAAIEQALLADITLANQNNGTPAITWCLVAGQSLAQSPPDDQSYFGRFTQITLKVHVYNRLAGNPS